MKTYLSNLNDRERWLLLIGGVCVLLYLYYALLYSPLNNRVTQGMKMLIEKNDTLAWMQKIQQQGIATKTKQHLDNSQLLTLLATKLKENRSFKAPYQLQQASSGEILLSFETVPFNLFLQWLKGLQEEYAISVKQLEVDPAKPAGVTHLQVTLTAS